MIKSGFGFTIRDHHCLSPRTKIRRSTLGLEPEQRLLVLDRSNGCCSHSISCFDEDFRLELVIYSVNKEAEIYRIR